MNCPVCGSQAKTEGSVFCEAGFYGGHGYEAEGDADVYRCEKCDTVFAAPVPDLRSERAHMAGLALEHGGYAPTLISRRARRSSSRTR